MNNDNVTPADVKVKEHDLYPTNSQDVDHRETDSSFEGMGR